MSYNPPDKYQKDNGKPTRLWKEFHPEVFWVRAFFIRLWWRVSHINERG